MAGSAWAVFELKLYVYREIAGVVRRNPDVEVLIHVDDVSLGASRALPRLTAAAMKRAALDLREGFEGRLGLPFAEDKKYLLASDDDTERCVRAALGSFAGEAVKQVRKLGIEHGLRRGGLRTRAVLNGRLKSWGQRRRKLAKLRRGAERSTRSRRAPWGV